MHAHMHIHVHRLGEKQPTYILQKKIKSLVGWWWKGVNPCLQSKDSTMGIRAKQCWTIDISWLPGETQPALSYSGADHPQCGLARPYASPPLPSGWLPASFLFNRENSQNATVSAKPFLLPISNPLSKLIQSTFWSNLVTWHILISHRTHWLVSNVWYYAYWSLPYNRPLVISQIYQLSLQLPKELL